MTRDASVSEPLAHRHAASLLGGGGGLTVEDVGVLLWLPLRCIRWLLLSSSHGAIRRIERTERFRLDAAERIQHLGVHGCHVELGLKRA